MSRGGAQAPTVFRSSQVILRHSEEARGERGRRKDSKKVGQALRCLCPEATWGSGPWWGPGGGGGGPTHLFSSRNSTSSSSMPWQGEKGRLL